MAEFGRKNAGARASSGARPAVNANVPAAIDAIRAGKLPAWTKAGIGQNLIVMAVTAVAFYFLFFPYAGNILRDIRLAGTWQPAYEMQAANGHCTRYYFLLTTCDAEIKSVAEPDSAPVKVAFMLGLVGAGGEAMVPVRSTRDPSAVTIAYAVETELWNRTLTFLVMSGFFVLLFLGMIASILSGRYKGGKAHLELIAGLETLQARAQAAPVEQRLAA